MLTLPGLALACDELGNRLGRNGRVYLHDVGRADDACNGRDVAQEIEIELLVQGCIYCLRRTDQKKCVAIGGCTHDRFGCDIAAAAWPIFDDEGLSEPL